MLLRFEILMADDKELNKWCSLRQALRYKPEHIEKNEIRTYKEKSMNEAHKQKVLKSLYTEPEEEGEEEKDESVAEQTESSNKKRRRKKKTKASNSNVESANTETDTVSKEKIMHVTENSVQNNLDSKDDKNDKGENEKNKNAQEKIVANKSKKQKRKNNLKSDGDAPISKKIKIENTSEKDSQTKTDINNIEIKNNNEKVVAVNKFAGQQKKKKKNRNSQFNQMNTGKNKLNYDDPTMSLNAERLKTYGINAKKLKNKLKYGNKKL